MDSPVTRPAVGHGRRTAVVTAPEIGCSGESSKAAGAIGFHSCRPNSTHHQVEVPLNVVSKTEVKDRPVSGRPADGFEDETEMRPTGFYQADDELWEVFIADEHELDPWPEPGDFCESPW